MLPDDSFSCNNTFSDNDLDILAETLECWTPSRKLVKPYYDFEAILHYFQVSFREGSQLLFDNFSPFG